MRGTFNGWLRKAPLWSSAFRPFYLLAALYAPMLALAGVLAWHGQTPGAPAGLALLLWHEHEMLFGFALAIVGGTLLTGLPSWAGTAEVRGAPLAMLVAFWLLGRTAYWLLPWIPSWLVALLDLMMPSALVVLLAAPLWRVRQRLYLLLLPILFALPLADAVFHVACIGDDAALARQALRATIWTLVLLFTLKGGLLTAVFTGNALRAKGLGDPLRVCWPLEIAAATLLLALATLDIAGAQRTWTGAAATACLLAQGLRVARWRGWRVADAALVPGLHLGFAWLLAALALKAASDLGAEWPESAWVHAFTIGALGMMMMSLMTRVALRHTGRALAVPPALRLAGPAMFVAALIRLVASMQGLGPAVLAIAFALWAACFVTYLAVFGRLLASPSVPYGE